MIDRKKKVKAENRNLRTVSKNGKQNINCYEQELLNIIQFQKKKM